MARRVSC